MNASVIQEIANQLGVAVDQVQQMIPMYASMKAAASMFAFILCVTVFLITCPTGIYCLKRAVACFKEDVDETAWTLSSIFTLLIALFMLVFATGTAFSVYMWTCFPDATFYQMLFDSVRRAK